MPTQAAMKGVPLALLSAVTTGTGVAIAVPNSDKNCQIEAVGAGTIGAGTVIVEENNSDPSYAGTWSQLASISAASFTGGASQTFHVGGCMTFVRARVSANITGGGTFSVNFIAG